MKKFVRLSIFLSLAIVLNIVEASIPLFNGNIPGFKLGLANIVTLYVLYTFSLKEAYYIGILRVILTGLLRTGLFNTYFIFSLAGCVLSIIMMYIGKKYLKLSIIGTSIMGSIFHSIGQIIVSIIILNMTSMIYYLPWLLIFSIITGIIVGIICKELIKHYEEYLIIN